MTSFISRVRGRRAGGLGGLQKRLIFILDTFGKKYPLEAMTTIQMLLLALPGGAPPEPQAWNDHTPKHLKPFQAFYTEWTAITKDMEFHRRAIGLADVANFHPMGRNARWVFDEVRRVLGADAKVPANLLRKIQRGAVGMPSPFTSEPLAADRRQALIAPVWATPRFAAAIQTLRQFNSALPTLIEWITNAPNAQPAGRTWQEAVGAAAVWHEAAMLRAQEAGKSVKSLQEFKIHADLGDGWTLVRLDTKEALIAEGAFMDHCVGSYNPDTPGQIIFSLRDPKGNSRVTINETRLRLVEARAAHNLPAAFPRAASYYAVVRRDLKDLEAMRAAGADIEVIQRLLPVVQARRWSLTHPTLAGFSTYVKILEEAQKRSSTAKKGQAAFEKPFLLPSVGLTWPAADRMWAAKKKRADYVGLGGSWRLHKVSEEQFEIRHARALATYREGPTATVPARWGGMTQETTFHKDVYALPVVQIYKDGRFVLRFMYGRAKSYPPALPGVQFTPLTLAFGGLGSYGMRFAGENALIASTRAASKSFKVLVPNPQNHLAPERGARGADWQIWSVPMDDCLQQMVRFEMDADGVPLDVRCEPIPAVATVPDVVGVRVVDHWRSRWVRSAWGLQQNNEDED